MNKRLLAVMLTIFCVMLTGCGLAVDADDVPFQPEENLEINDQLVGMLITLDHFCESTEDAYMDMPLWNPQTSGMEEPLHYASNQGKRLYAQRTTETKESESGSYTSGIYEFPEGTGIPHMAYLVLMEDENESYWSFNMGQGICEGSRSVVITDDCTEVSIEGKIYVDKNAVDLIFHLNPVYQNTKGEVYALGTTPVGYHAVSMSGCSETIRQEINAPIGDRIITSGGSVTMEIEAISLPEQYVILEMDENSQMLKRTEYAPEEMPKEYVPMEETAYIVVQAYFDGIEDGAVYSPNDGDAWIRSFYPGDFGICIKGYTKIIWEDAK